MRPLTNVTSLLSLNAVIENSTTISLPPKSDPSLNALRVPLNDTVSAEVRQILTHRTAAFRELQVTSTIGPTTNPELLLDIRLLFSWSRGSAYIEMSNDWGKWESPIFSVRPYPSGYNILPTRLAIDIVFADELMKRAGYMGSYEAVDVKWPGGLQLGYDQPYYCFLMEGNRPDFVYVGINDHIVTTSLPKAEDVVQDDGISTA